MQCAQTTANGPETYIPGPFRCAVCRDSNDYVEFAFGIHLRSMLHRVMERDIDKGADEDRALYNEPVWTGEDSDHAFLELRIHGKKVPLGWHVVGVIVLLAVSVVATLLVQTLT